MSESFDTLLSDLAHSAAASTRPPGPVAARGRGRQRAVRRRAAASVLSVSLLGGAGAAAVVASQHSGVPAPVTHTSTPTAPSTVVPAPPSPTGPDSASPSPSSSSTAVTGDLHVIVPEAWTPVDQFPASTFFQWKANMSQPSINTSERQWFYSCLTHGTLTHLGALGYQEKSYTSTVSRTPGSPNDAADQVLFFFPSTAAAEQAMTTIRDDYAHCPELTRGVSGNAITGTVTQTEQLDGGYAWTHDYFTSTGTPADPADIGAYNHEYFAQRGDVVELVWLGYDGSVDSASQDLGFLNSLETNLCIYGGNCPAGAQPLAATVSATGSTTLVPGGAYIQFAVTVANNSGDTIKNVAPIVSLAQCSCVNTPTRTMPKGDLQLWDPSSSAWKNVFYDTQGTGMDYILSASVDPVPGFDLAGGQSVSFKFRVRMSPVSADNLTGKFHVQNGTTAFDVSLVHPPIASGQRVSNAQIGNSPAVSIPITVVLK